MSELGGGHLAKASTRSIGQLLPFILIQQILGALSFPVSKFGLAVIEPFTFAFFRFVISGVVLVLLARSRSHVRPIERSDYKRFVLLGFLIIPINQTFYLWGQSLTSAAHGSILFATTPIWVFLMAKVILKERLTWRRGLGIAIALCGAMLIITGGALKLGLEYLTGDLIVMVSVLAWASFTILGKPMVEKYGALRATAYSLGIGTLMYFPFGAWRAIQFDYGAVNGEVWLTVIYMALGVSVAAYVIWYWLLNYMEASRLAVFSNLQPVIATAVAFLFLGEVPGATFFIGGAIVLAGVLLTEV